MRAESQLGSPAGSAQNLVDLLLQRAQSPSKVAASWKTGGRWEDVTWGRVLEDVKALSAGLVAEVHPDDELDAAVDRVVTTLLAGSRTAQVAAKRLLREVAVPWEEGALRRETLSVRACAAGPDGREGVAAFLAKRPPAFPSAAGPAPSSTAL